MLLPALSPSGFAQQARPLAVLRARAHDGAGNPVAGVFIQATVGQVVVAGARTNEQGEAELPNLEPGNYEISATKDGYETLKQENVTLSSDQAIEIEFALIPKTGRKDSVDVVATPENPVEQGASVPTTLEHPQIQKLPNKPSTVADVLPLIPGVVRTPDDEIRISGSSEHSSAFIVN